MNDRRGQWTRFLAIVIILVMMGGISCAYFNAFYNARRYFNDGERDWKAASANPNATGQPPTQNYNKAIEAAARLLESYPDSKWADDALLLMGKSYYRIRQWNRADRKFQELFANHPESPLIPEGKYWAALTMKEMGKRNDAITELRSMIGAELPKELKTEVLFALADMLFEDKSYDKARVEYDKIVEKSKSNSERARAQYRIAECLDLSGEDSLAATAYLNVLVYKPERKMEFDAQFHYGILLKRLERYDEVRKVFESLLQKDIYFSHFPEVELELADLLYLTGNVEEAKTKYQRLVEVNPRTEVSARAYYELGRIALLNERNVDKARDNFSKVRGEFAQSKYGDPAQEEITLLDNFKAISSSREHVATQLVSLEEALKGLRERAERQDSTEQPGSKLQSDSLKMKEQIEDFYHQLDAFDFRMAEYYLFDMHDLDSVTTILGFLIKPGVSDSVRARSLAAMAVIQGDSLHNTALADSCYRVLLTGYFGTNYENFARQKLGLARQLTAQDSLQRLYDEADSLLWMAEDTSRALGIFQELAGGDTTSPLTGQSQYVVGWVYEHMIGNKDSARAAYQRLVDRFPGLELAQEVKRRIEATVEGVGVPDSLKESSSQEAVSSAEKQKGVSQPAEELPTKRRILRR
jgi:TolA-binding protein